MPLVTVERVAKRYPPPLGLRSLFRREAERLALAGVSFEIAAGEIVALIGPNGAGKSTLLRILSGVLLPSEGRATVAGLDVVADRPRSRREIGAAFGEDRSLQPRLTAMENLRFFGALYGLGDARARIGELAEKLEAAAFLDRRVRTLSSGEKARVALVRALLHRPKAIVLDELTRSLDPGAAARLRKKVIEEVAGSGAAVMFASHDLAEVESISSRVLLLDQGRIAAAGSYAEVKTEAERVFARSAA